MRRGLMVLLLLSTACRPAPPEGVDTIPIPDGRAGIGFDDLQFSPAHGLLVPAGRTGTIALVDPRTRAVTTIGGFGAEPLRFAGHNQGPTSLHAGGGRLFVVDRTAGEVVVVDAAARTITGRSKVAGTPDYVRWVEATGEAWVTEPDADQLEVFAIEGGAPVSRAVVPIPGGPESLIVDARRGVAYAHLWAGATIAIALPTHEVIAQWPNGCAGSRGIALDEERGLLVAACVGGRLAALDVEHDGALLAELEPPVHGIDVIGYSPALRHLYTAGADTTNLGVIALGDSGEMTVLDTAPTIAGARCVVADDRGNAYVCDVENGQLLVYPDRTGGAP